MIDRMMIFILSELLEVATKPLIFAQNQKIKIPASSFKR